MSTTKILPLGIYCFPSLGTHKEDYEAERDIADCSGCGAPILVPPVCARPADFAQAVCEICASGIIEIAGVPART